MTTTLYFASLMEGATAGLTVFGYDYALLGLCRDTNGRRVGLIINRSADKLGAEEHETANAAATNAGRFYLRVTVTKVGPNAICRFAYSFDQPTFVLIGEPFEASVDRWIGAKFGVIVTASASATKTGHADFDWCHVTPLER